MRFYQFAYYFWLIVCIAVEVGVMNITFPLWRKRRLRFAVLFAWSALVGLFRILFAHYLWYFQVDAEHSIFFWCAGQVLSLVGTILYAVAVVLLVRYFLAIPGPLPLPEAGPANKSLP